ncbi:hypothetical protein ACFVFI_17935 [Streptomyces sp. NPDC057705]|uniref:hypothetical protein n=1 Tax=Streptomyces sp. NPDC057705 TaxID=3346222 RepID=UPI0036C2C9B4
MASADLALVLPGRRPPLPEILAPRELATARLIKIDAEGAEASLMDGLAPALGDLRADAESASYPSAVRQPTAPVRWDGPITDMTDMIFSRIDTDHL